MRAASPGRNCPEFFPPAYNSSIFAKCSIGLAFGQHTPCIRAYAAQRYPKPYFVPVEPAS